VQEPKIIVAKYLVQEQQKENLCKIFSARTKKKIVEEVVMQEPKRKRIIVANFVVQEPKKVARI